MRRLCWHRPAACASFIVSYPLAAAAGVAWRGVAWYAVVCCGVLRQFVLGEIHPPVSETFDIVMHMVEKALGGTGDSDCQRDAWIVYCKRVDSLVRHTCIDLQPVRARQIDLVVRQWSPRAPFSLQTESNPNR